VRRAPRDGIEAALAGLAAAVFFCRLRIYALWRLSGRDRPLVISRQGIVDNARPSASDSCAGIEIAELYEYRYRSGHARHRPENLDTLLMKQPA